MLTTDIIIAAIAKAGTEAKLGAALGGYSQNAVWAAKSSGRASGKMARRIDEWSGGQIARAVLRPDVFGEASDAELGATMRWLREHWPDKLPRPAYLLPVSA